MLWHTYWLHESHVALSGMSTMWAVWGDPCRVWRPKRRSRSELVTTLTEESPIAAPAMIGLSRPSAARGIAAVL
nr:hypothetical protein [Mycobacterium intracellulare]